MLWPTELSSLVLRLRSGSFNSQMVYHERAKRVEWWVREDLNLHALRHSHLKAACIPISPLTPNPLKYTVLQIQTQSAAGEATKYFNYVVNVRGGGLDYIPRAAKF